MSKTKQVRDGRASLRPLLLISRAVFYLWVIAWGLILLAFSNWSQRGQFGDMFGAINSLFSGLAFAGIIFTIYLQREELALQRKELELTRSQLARSADAQEKSEKALERQVEALKKTARLNALNSIIEHYGIMISSTPNASKKQDFENQRLEYIRDLEMELKTLSKF